MISNVETRHNHAQLATQAKGKEKEDYNILIFHHPLYSSGNSELCSKIEEEPKLSSFLSSFKCKPHQTATACYYSANHPLVDAEKKKHNEGNLGGHLFVNATTSIAEIH